MTQDEPVRLLLAEDQVMIREALAALLGAEPEALMPPPAPLAEIVAAASNHRALIESLAAALADEPSLLARDGGFIRVGYRAELRGKQVVFALGYSHSVVFDVPTGIDIVIEKQTHVTVTGVDRQLVGQVAANIRRLRKQYFSSADQLMTLSMAAPSAALEHILPAFKAARDVGARITIHVGVGEGNPGQVSPVGGYNDGVARVYVARVVARNGGTDYELFVNGQTAGVNHADGTIDVTLAGSDVRIGSTYGQSVEGDVAEVVATKGAPSDADLAKLTSYLIAKYKIVP